MTADDSPELRVGRVVKAHGVKGAVRVELLSDFPDRFTAGHAVDIEGRSLTVGSSEDQGGGLLVRFNGIEDRTAAEALVGKYCTVPLDKARALPEDHFYHFQLVGLSVFDLRQQRELGRVQEILTYSANDVLRVSAGKRDLLIPMVKNVVKAVDPSRGVITVDLPEEVNG